MAGNYRFWGQRVPWRQTGQPIPRNNINTILGLGELRQPSQACILFPSTFIAEQQWQWAITIQSRFLFGLYSFLQILRFLGVNVSWNCVTTKKASSFVVHSVRSVFIDPTQCRKTARSLLGGILCQDNNNADLGYSFVCSDTPTLKYFFFGFEIIRLMLQFYS